MDHYQERIHDPLLFLNSEKSQDTFELQNTFADGMGTIFQEENNLNIDGLEENGHLGDTLWLHNSSFSSLAHLHGDESSDSSNLIPVNPQTVLPMRSVQQNQRPENLMSMESANSAAMRLTANCSSLMASPPEDKDTPSQSQQGPQTPTGVMHQEHQTIRILQVASVSQGGSPAKNIILQPSVNSQSRHATQTFVLTSNGNISSLPQGLTITTNGGSHMVTQTPQHTQYVLSSPQKMTSISADRLHTITTDKSGRVLLKAGNNLMSPSQASPVLLGRLQTGVQSQLYQQPLQATTAQPHQEAVSSTTHTEERAYPKPVFSYSCLIALALKNSKNGSLPVSEIYNFMCENFPYFKTAPDGWKNSVRHNLSLNKCFAKVDNPKLTQGAKKGCLWALNPAKVTKMEDEIVKWGKKDPAGLLTSMAYPENLEAIEKGQAGLHYAARMKSAENQPCQPCTPLRTEATPTKREFSPSISAMNQEQHSPMKVDSFVSRMDRYTGHQGSQLNQVKTEWASPAKFTQVKTEWASPVKLHFSPIKQEVFQQQQSQSHFVQHHHQQSPARSQYFSPVKSHTTPHKSHTTPHKSHTPLRLGQQDILDLQSFTDLPMGSDALADIVLQNPMWDEDLENNLNLDLICDSPSSSNHGLPQMLLTQSPLTVRSSPNLSAQRFKTS